MKPIPSNITFSNDAPASYMFIAATSIAISGFFAKLCLVSNIPLRLTIFFRFSVPLVILLVFFVITNKLLELSSTNIKTHIVRAMFLTLSQVLFFLSTKKLSLSESMVLYSTGPLFITLYDITLRNKVNVVTVISLLLGASGGFFMLHAQKSSLNVFVLIGLASGFCLSVSQILLHKCSRKESSVNTMFFVYLFTTAFSIFLLISDNSSRIYSLSLYTYKPIIFLIFIGAFSLLNQFFRGKAYSLIKMPSSLSPILYFSVFVSAALDAVFFKQIPDIESIFGGALILVGSYFSIKKG